jgi:dephospho-CoA kinase
MYVTLHFCYVSAAAVVDGAVDRQALGSLVLSSPEALRRLESIVHPLVAAEREEFFSLATQSGAFAVVYDVPLLYEKGMQADVDVVIVVTASPETQRGRVLGRPGASAARFEAILAQQLPDLEKRARGDYVIDTDYAGTLGEGHLYCVMLDIIYHISFIVIHLLGLYVPHQLIISTNICCAPYYPIIGFAQAKAQLSRALEDIIASRPEHYRAWKQSFCLSPEATALRGAHTQFGI